MRPHTQNSTRPSRNSRRSRTLPASSISQPNWRNLRTACKDYWPKIEDELLHQVFALKSINEQRVMADPIGANPSTRTSLIVGLSLLKFALVQRGLL